MPDIKNIEVNGTTYSLKDETARSTNQIISGNFSLVEGSNASKSYIKGETMTKDGQLYVATGSIAKGEALTPGSNIAVVNLKSLMTPFVGTAQNGYITAVQNEYGYIGTTDACLAVYPFGLCVLKFYAGITKNVGSTEVVIANIAVPPTRWYAISSNIGQSSIMFHLRSNGNLGVNQTSASSTGTYHVELVYFTNPMVPPS